MSDAGIKVEIINQHNLLSEMPDAKADELLTADEIPVWLNELFVERILQQHHRDGNLKVKNLRIKQCGGKGDSYASMMYRVGIFFCDGINPDTTQFASCIAKTLPEHDIAIEKLGSNNYNVQNKEMEIYQNILPEMQKILASIDEDSEIFPLVLAVDRKLDVIVLEDLAEKKFVMADRLKGLDLDHTLMALRKLARMHAASVIIHKKNPSAFAHLDTGFFTRKTDVFHVMFESLCEAFIEEVALWEGYEHYGKKLKNVRETLIARAQRAFDCDPGDLHVLNHGDLWTNNLMYTYDESGAPVDAVLLDFQFASFGSPALDLIYFLFTSTNEDLRPDRIEELMQFYFYELKSLLMRLDYDMETFPSLHTFSQQVLKKFFYTFTSALLIFPVMVTQDKDADFESLMSRDDRALGFKKRIFKNPRYQEIAMKILPILDRKGILDEM